MKRVLPLLFISILILNTAEAQVSDKSDFKRFGFRAGANFSHINFAKGSPPPTVPINTTWGAGITFGFLLLVPLSEKFFIQPEYMFSQMGGEVKSSKTVYKLNYFSMPVFLKYQLNERFSLMTGPQFDVLLNSKMKVNGSSTDITHDTEERSIGAVAGIEFQIIESLSLCARYMQGLNHIGLGQRSNVQEFKYEMTQMTACVKF